MLENFSECKFVGFADCKEFELLVICWLNADNENNLTKQVICLN
jgi:hypothetical protein